MNQPTHIKENQMYALEWFVIFEHYPKKLYKKD